MNAVPFDTLKLARRLEQAGMAAPVAAGTAEALADAMGVSDLATKADLARLRSDLEGDIAGLRTALKHDIDALRSELKADVTGLRAELKSDTSSLRAEMVSEFALVRRDMEVLRRDIVIRFGSMLVIAVGVMLTAMRYLPPHP